MSFYTYFTKFEVAKEIMTSKRLVCKDMQGNFVYEIGCLLWFSDYHLVFHSNGSFLQYVVESGKVSV